MNISDFADVHVRMLVASLDRAVDDLLDALTDADACGAYDVPHHRRNAGQNDAIIQVAEAQEAVEEYLELTFADRYGLDVRVELEVN